MPRFSGFHEFGDSIAYCSIAPLNFKNPALLCVTWPAEAFDSLAHHKTSQTHREITASQIILKHVST
jgi:hypothetical protein